jgi:RNA-directed DNA polymerase
VLDALGNFPEKELVRQWLKAGYVDNGVFSPTPSGTGQRAVISPLLANIALHGMEAVMGITYTSQGQVQGRHALVHYADDFVVFCCTKADAEAVIALLTQWLQERGLTFSEEKTRIVQLSEGFDFLGYNVRHYPAPTSRLGAKLLIKPSAQAVQAVRDKLKRLWQQARFTPLPAILRDFNAVIRGWANYHRIVVASETVAKLDSWMTHRAYRYVKRQHPHTSWHWKKDRY